MRETKFRYRFKHQKTGEELKAILSITDIEQQTFTPTVFKDSLFNWEILSRDEWTGLKDKNGVEIFESDLVQWNSPQGAKAQVCWGEWDNGEIYEAHESGYGWYTTFNITYLRRKGKTYTSAHVACLSHFYGEVIGNIYENPELLEAKDD